MPLQSLAALIIIIAGLRVFSTQVGPLALGLTLVIAVAPIQTWLEKRNTPPAAAIVATLLAAYGILVAFAAALGWSGYEIARLVTSDKYADSLDELQADLSEFLSKLGIEEGAVRDGVTNLDISRVANGLTTALNGVLGLTSALLLVLLAMFFMVTDAKALGHRLDEISSHRPLVNEAMDNFVAKTRSYLVVSSAFGIVVAVLEGVALWAMGIPLVGVWMILSFLTNYIPNIGFVVGVIPPALIALLTFDANRMIWVIITYSVINFVIQSLIQPRIVGDSVGLSTTLTFFSLIFWSFVLGPLGAILAVPMTLLAKALLIDVNPQLRWLEPLISLKPSESQSDP